MKAFIHRLVCSLVISFMILAQGMAQEFSGQAPEVPSEESISIPKGENGFAKIFKGQPGNTALYAAIIPGGGHFYNKKYLSGVIAAGADIFMIYLAVDQNNFYHLLNDGYLCLLREECVSFTVATSSGDALFTDAAVLKINRDNARRTREYQWLYAGITHFGTIVWAFVQAHLIDFDDTEDLSFDLKMISPNTLSFAAPSPGLSLTINLNRDQKQIPKAFF